MNITYRRQLVKLRQKSLLIEIPAYHLMIPEVQVYFQKTYRLIENLQTNNTFFNALEFDFKKPTFITLQIGEVVFQQHNGIFICTLVGSNHTLFQEFVSSILCITLPSDNDKLKQMLTNVNFFMSLPFVLTPYYGSKKTEVAFFACSLI